MEHVLKCTQYYTQSRHMLDLLAVGSVSGIEINCRR